MMALAAVAASFYPVIASLWPHSHAEFERTCQRALDTVLLLGGLGVCVVCSAPGFLLSLIGKEFGQAAPFVMLLGALCIAKAVTSTAGPVFYIIKAQKQAFQFVAVALVMRIAVAMLLAPAYGTAGVIAGAIAVEICFGVIPSVWILQRLSGIRFRWRTVALVCLITPLSVALARLAGAGLLAATLAPVLWLAFALCAGILPIGEAVRLRFGAGRP
jgi:O-antigen/teichoic acid export membrane protein